jgi:hypothetical protein
MGRKARETAGGIDAPAAESALLLQASNLPGVTAAATPASRHDATCWGLRIIAEARSAIPAVSRPGGLLDLAA